MAKLAVDVGGQVSEAVSNPATPASMREDREMKKQLFRARTKTDDELPIPSLAVDAAGRVAGECTPSPKGDTAEQKERFRERVRRTKGALLQPGGEVLALCPEGVVQAAAPEEAVCAAHDGTIHQAHILASPKRSPAAEKKKQALRARRARENAGTEHPVFACDHEGGLAVHDAREELVVASADGTIHQAHVRPISPVHSYKDKKIAKALYRSSPKHGPSPVLTAAPDGLVELNLGRPAWNFWQPEVEAH